MYDKLTHAKISEKFRLVPYYISVKKIYIFFACLNSFFAMVHYAPTVRYAPPSPITNWKNTSYHNTITET